MDMCISRVALTALVLASIAGQPRAQTASDGGDVSQFVGSWDLVADREKAYFSEHAPVSRIYYGVKSRLPRRLGAADSASCMTSSGSQNAALHLLGPHKPAVNRV